MIIVSIDERGESQCVSKILSKNSSIDFTAEQNEGKRGTEKVEHRLAKLVAQLL